LVYHIDFFANTGHLKNYASDLEIIARKMGRTQQRQKDEEQMLKNIFVQNQKNTEQLETEIAEKMYG